MEEGGGGGPGEDNIDILCASAIHTFLFLLVFLSSFHLPPFHSLLLFLIFTYSVKFLFSFSNSFFNLYSFCGLHIQFSLFLSLDFTHSLVIFLSFLVSRSRSHSRSRSYSLVLAFKYGGMCVCMLRTYVLLQYDIHVEINSDESCICEMKSKDKHPLTLSHSFPN